MPSLKRKKQSDGGTQDIVDKNVMVSTLTSYWNEADMARRGGPNGRDDKWNENLDLYWNRFDFGNKAPWQSQNTMPEVPAFVDRFAGAMKEALVSVPEAFYTVQDPSDAEGDLATKIKALEDIWLSRCGTTPNGIPIAFPGVFEEQMKMGAIMACCSCVRWCDGRVVVESQDPRNVWMDHSGLNLYRVRRKTIDRHMLKEYVGLKDADGKRIYDLEQMNALVGAIQLEDQANAERLSGHGQQNTGPRVPVVLDEYLATILGPDGRPIYGGKTLSVIANGRFMIRGPEKNPYWHNEDWLVYTPLIPTPLSVYGRSYMEDFGPVAKTFNELTNLILDAVYTSSIRAFAVVPGLLLNPGQIAEGITPNKMFMLDEGIKPEDFAKAIELGTLPPEAVQVWTAMKNELREAAGMNEIGLGQLAPKGRTSATEINSTQQSSSAIVRSVAQTVETRYLDPILDRVWKTGLQHAKQSDDYLARAAGEEMWAALYARRRELASKPVTFQARGISTMLQKSTKLQAVLQMLQVISSNELLLKAFLERVDLRRLVAFLFQMSDIDLSKFQTTQREQMIRSVTEPLQAAGASAEGAPPEGEETPVESEAGSVADLLGVGRG